MKGGGKVEGHQRRNDDGPGLMPSGQRPGSRGGGQDQKRVNRQDMPDAHVGARGQGDAHEKRGRNQDVGCLAVAFS